MAAVQSIERAFAVLRALATGPAGVTDIAVRVGLPKSTVARLLSTLEGLEIIVQHEVGGSYRLGPGLADLASSIHPSGSLVAAARPHLVELVEQVGESAGISAADGARVHFLDQVDGDRQVRVRNWTGELLPMHSTSSGMVLLAFADDALRSAVMRNPMERSTAHTITTAQALGRRLAEIRTVGHCWAYEEFEDGLNSVAAPVRDRRNHVVAAVHIHGPAFRFPGKAATRIGQLVVECGQRIGAALT
jgi:DNA-binding IclR family transcriptional regulator